jgi:hypothetical protein
MAKSEMELIAAPAAGGSLETYKIWACDNQIYGPVGVDVLIAWAQENRVQRDTWVYLERAMEWRPARKLPELEDQFPPGEETRFLEHRAVEITGMTMEELRQFNILASLTNHELADLIKFGELCMAMPGDIIIKRNDPGDAVYFLLSGKVRARIQVGGEDKTLSHIPAGQFFGEMAMFTQTTRSADVVAVDESRLLRLTSQSFRSLIAERPSTAAPLLFAISGIMASRIMEDNKRFQREIASGFVWR